MKFWAETAALDKEKKFLFYKLPALIILLLVIKLEREKHLPVRKEVPVYLCKTNLIFHGMAIEMN